MFKLNYKGSIDDQVGKIMGPNLLRERLIVESQEYDPEADRTTLTLRIYIGQ